MSPPVRPESGGWLQDAWQRLFGGPAPAATPILPFAPVDATAVRGPLANVRPPSNTVMAQDALGPATVTPLPGNPAYGPGTAFRHLVEATGEFEPGLSDARGMGAGLLAQFTAPIRSAGAVTTAVQNKQPGAAVLAALGLAVPPDLGGEVTPELDALMQEYHSAAGQLAKLGTGSVREQVHAALLQDRLGQLASQIAERRGPVAAPQLPPPPGTGIYDVQLPDGSVRAIHAASPMEASQTGRVIRFQQGPWQPSARNPELFSQEPPAAALDSTVAVGGRNVLHSGLSRDDAVARMKELTGSGERAQMQRTADGTFQIVKKGPVQPVGAKVPTPAKAQEVAPGTAGTPNEAGFQSRLLTALRTNPKLVNQKMSAGNWAVTLQNTPGIPKAELAAVTHGILTAAEKPAGKLTADDMAQLVAQHSPVADLTRTVHEAPGGPAESTFDEDAAIRDARDLAHENLLGERAYNTATARSHLAYAQSALARGGYGERGARRVIDKIVSEHYPELGVEGDTGFDHNDEYELEPDLTPERIRQLIDLASPAQLQMPGFGSPLHPQASQEALSHLQHVDRHMRNAYNLHNDVVNDVFDPNWIDDYVHQARFDHELEHEGATGDPGDTEYSEHQRVDPEAPYREILIHQPGLGLEAGHFAQKRDLIAHARGEIHNDDYLMLEGQSDVAKRMRRVLQNNDGEFTPSQQTFLPTEHWAQLATGASLRQAAEEGSNTFNWASPQNRMDLAQLNEESANATYGHAIPKAVKRIFDHLGIPLEPVKKFGEEAMGVRLSPEARRKILTYGVPALGLGLAFTPPAAPFQHLTPAAVRQPR